jgi:hypothetical protein
VRPPRDPSRFQPLFVLATPRSCSSVVAAMIGQHPDLAGLPELKLFCYATIGELEASLPAFWIARGITHRSPGLVRALAELEFGDQTPASLLAARAWLRERSHWLGADVFDVLMTRLHPRAAVEKSPENVASAAALARLATAYPRARYVHLTRHPIATQRSMENHAVRLKLPDPLRGQPTAGVAAWFEMNQRIVEFCASLPPERTMRVRAEDVINDAEPRLRAVAEWLGLRSDPAALEAMQHPEASPYASFGPADSGIVGGNDPGFLADPALRGVELPRALEPPEGWLGGASLWRMVTELAEQLGYAEHAAR